VDVLEGCCWIIRAESNGEERGARAEA